MSAPKDLIILGTGVHGLEMAEIVRRIDRVAATWNLLGFIAPDDQAQRVGEIRCGLPVLGTSDVLGRYPDAMLVPDNEFPHDLPLPGEPFPGWELVAPMLRPRNSSVFSLVGRPVVL